MSLAQITLRASAQLACSLGHLTASMECHAKPFSQRCLPRAVGADSPVTGLQLFAELEWQLSHPSSWPRVYRFMLRSLLISEPVTEKDKGPREVTHGDLSDLNLPRPSPQIQRCNLCYREDQHYWRRRKSHCEHTKTGVSLRARQLLFFSALLIQGV